MTDSEHEYGSRSSGWVLSLRRGRAARVRWFTYIALAAIAAVLDWVAGDRGTAAFFLTVAMAAAAYLAWLIQVPYVELCGDVLTVRSAFVVRRSTPLSELECVRHALFGSLLLEVHDGRTLAVWLPDLDPVDRTRLAVAVSVVDPEPPANKRIERTP